MTSIDTAWEAIQIVVMTFATVLTVYQALRRLTTATPSPAANPEGGEGGGG
jgi:hypothetical protein